jgi:hypothetical protein
MENPIIGKLTKNQKFDWYESELIKVPCLNNSECKFIFERYEKDLNKIEFDQALTNFLNLSPEVFNKINSDLYHYYIDSIKDYGLKNYLKIESSENILNYVHIRAEVMICRRVYGDKGIYITLEGECDWEKEHGLQIVFKSGEYINKIGPFDSHLTNSDAYAREEFEDVIYVSRQML